MSSLIRLTDDARQTFRTSLGGQSVRLTVWWQPSDERWYLSVDGIASGTRLVEGGWPLLGLNHGLGGEVYVYGPGEPGRHAWVQTHSLLFVDDVDLGR